MGATKIEWADVVWNPVTGCTKVSEGCRNCYAERVARRFEQVHAPAPGQCWDNPPTFGDVICHPDRLDQPLHWRKPRRVFVCSMGDLFHEDVLDEFIGRVFGVMGIAERQTFMVLTKRPERMLAWIKSRPRDEAKPEQAVVPCEFGDMSYSLPWPLPNVWLGVSVENQATADERIPLLLQTPAAVRFVSCEPMLGPVDLSKWIPFVMPPFDEIDEDPRVVGYPPESAFTNRDKLDWVICGCESGPGARLMDATWARSLLDQCKGAGVPFFFKQRMVAGKIEKMPKIDGVAYGQFPEVK